MPLKYMLLECACSIKFTIKQKYRPTNSATSPTASMQRAVLHWQQLQDLC